MIDAQLPALPPRRVNPVLSDPELRSATLDGELLCLADDYLPIDLPVTARERAAAVGRQINDPRVIISDRSAAWVWGWLHPQPSLTTSVSVRARIPSTDRRRLGAREVVIADHEVWRPVGVAVTSPLRTLIDLARHDVADDIIPVLARGVREHDIRRDQIESVLNERSRLSFVRTARARLAEAVLRAQELNRC